VLKNKKGKLSGVLPEQSMIQMNAERIVRKSEAGLKKEEVLEEARKDRDFKKWVFFFGGLFVLMIILIILFIFELNK
jgi:hypothetical protein